MPKRKTQEKKKQKIEIEKIPKKNANNLRTFCTKYGRMT